MSRGHEFNIFRAAVFKGFYHVDKFAFGIYPAARRAADLLILTENTAERTTREKDRPRAVFAAYAGLFAFVKPDKRHDHPVSAAAFTQNSVFSVTSAFARTNTTFHFACFSRKERIAFRRSSLLLRTVISRLYSLCLLFSFRRQTEA